MENCFEKDLEKLPSNKPQRMLEEAPAEIRDYVLCLERQLAGILTFETRYNEVSQKYLDVQEDLFALQIQMVEQKYKIKELTQENVGLRKETERLNNESANPSTSKIVLQKNDAPAYSIRDDKEQTVNVVIDSNKNNANSILVKNVPRELFGANPKKGVIWLGQHMNLQLTETDVRTISAKERKFYERQNMQPDKLIFIVELSNSDTKVKILKNKERLKVHPKTKDIEITEFVSEEVYNLYQYAKVLKTCGYNLVYWRNNSVYAKKTRSSNSKPILIETVSQVDVLKEIK